MQKVATAERLALNALKYLYNNVNDKTIKYNRFSKKLKHKFKLSKTVKIDNIGWHVNQIEI